MASVGAELQSLQDDVVQQADRIVAILSLLMRRDPGVVATSAAEPAKRSWFQRTRSSIRGGVSRWIGR